MKLRNKKTGEIYNACHIVFGESIDDLERTRWKTLEEFNEDWEDAPEEEPKDYWFINDLNGEPMKIELKECSKSSFIGWSEERKQIGNYFETKEEAEKAVEKLKAWKRLKDKGFKITLRGCKGNAWLEANWGNLQGDYSDIRLLFGGEE